jgi:NADPH-dependent curcumin reductase CurA
MGMKINTEKWVVKKHSKDVTQIMDMYEKIVEELDVNLKDDEMLLKTHFVSIDPYLHGITLDTPLGNHLGADSVMEVLEAGKNAIYKKGDFVQGFGGWQTYLVSNGQEALWQTGMFPMVFPKYRKLDKTTYMQDFSLTASLGALGGSGMAAWGTVTKVLDIKPGDTVVISGASGSVGEIVGQLAKIKGAKNVVGICGSDEKIAHLKSLGFDNGINYKLADNYEKMVEALNLVAPEGVDKYFDNIGGYTTDAVFSHLNVYSIVAICWQMALQTGSEPRIGPRMLDITMFNRTTIRGIFGLEWFTEENWAALIDELGGYIKSGKVKCNQTIHRGFDNIPKAYSTVFNSTGANRGKILVEL